MNNKPSTGSSTRALADEPRGFARDPVARFAPADNLYDAIRSDVAAMGGVEFQPLMRRYNREPPFSDLDDDFADGE